MSEEDNVRRSATYEIGYRRPPKAHQFKSGQSGNPKGRPRGAKSLNTILVELLNRKITVQENGRPRRVSIAEALVHGQVHSALKGDRNAVRLIMDAMRALPEPDAQGSTEIPHEDQRLIAEALERMLRAKSASPGSSGEMKS